MKLTLIQKDINKTNYLEYLDNVNNNVDLVCLGELATSGCFYNNGQADNFSKIINSLSSYNFAVCLGMPREANNQLFNSYLFYQNGKYQIYNKINLFESMNETQVFKSGDRIGLFETPFGRLGIAICYDIRFPELFQNLKKAGSDMIIIPAAFPRVRIRDWRQLLVQRAQETKLTVIGINAVGDDRINIFGGSTMVISPEGEIIAQADEVNESIIEVEL